MSSNSSDDDIPGLESVSSSEVGCGRKWKKLNGRLRPVPEAHPLFVSACDMMYRYLSTHV